MLYQRWKFLGGENSLANGYLSYNFGVDDFYPFWIDTTWDPRRGSILKNFLVLGDTSSQLLTNRELFLDLHQQQTDLLAAENDAVFAAFEDRLGRYTSEQMDLHNRLWLDTSIERANAQLAEAHFQVLEDRLDTSVELEISGHLQQLGLRPNRLDGLGAFKPNLQFAQRVYTLEKRRVFTHIRAPEGRRGKLW